MSYYMEIVRDAIKIIENNIDTDVKVSSISNSLHVSEFHFNRLFTAITGITPKKYIIRRKLTLAAMDLRKTKDSVIDIAIKWGFNYSEDFSRAFKRHFEMTPIAFRVSTDSSDKKYYYEPIKKLSEREFINKNGKVELKAIFKSIEQINLSGSSYIVSSADDGHYKELDKEGINFLKDTAANKELQQGVFYSLVSCYGHGSDLYDVYLGKERLTENDKISEIRMIPQGWYACFKYDGTMKQIYKDFEKDFYKWIIQKGIVLMDNGVNMISRYQISHNDNVSLDEIMIPILEPVR